MSVLKLYKILVVDDDITMLASVNDILLSAPNPYTVLNAANVETAQTIIRNEVPDLVITDWVLPTLSGLDLVNYMVENKELQHIPIIVFTGVMTRQQSMLEALDKGAIDFLKKPLDELELLARVKRLLSFVELQKTLQEERAQKLEAEKKALKQIIEAQDKELTSKALTIGKYNELIKNISTQFNDIKQTKGKIADNKQLSRILAQINISLQSENWDDFMVAFENQYPYFFENLKIKFPKLTRNELRLCALLKLNLTTKEISAITLQSLRSIEMARHRLRQKLNMQPGDTFFYFL